MTAKNKVNEDVGKEGGGSGGGGGEVDKLFKTTDGEGHCRLLAADCRARSGPSRSIRGPGGDKAGGMLMLGLTWAVRQWRESAAMYSWRTSPFPR